MNFFLTNLYFECEYFSKTGKLKLKNVIPKINKTVPNSKK